MLKLTYNLRSKKYVFISLLILIILLTILAVNCYFGRSSDKVVNQKFVALSTEGSVTKSIQSDFENLFENSDYVLYIEKIDVRAPIVMNVDGSDEKIYNDALKNGVAHLGSSVIPEDKGNTVIFGHSSQATGIESKYGEVFARLDELIEGDKINIIRSDRYVASFEVAEKKIVDTHDVSVVDQTSDEQLTIITCWPIGTAEQRLVVVAKLKN